MNQGPTPYDAKLQTMMLDPGSDAPQRKPGLALHSRILLGLLFGVSAGLLANVTLGGDDPRLLWVVRNLTEPVGVLFLRGLLMIVVPLIGSSLVLGVAGIGDVRRLGRVGARTFLYALVVSAISVAIGLGLANLIRPGERVRPETAEQLKLRYSMAASQSVASAQGLAPSTDAPLLQVVKTLVPSNPVQAIAGETPQMLQLMFFALVVGVATTLLPRATIDPFLRVMEGIYAISAKVVDLIMRAAPYAVACLLFTTVSHFGLDLLVALFWFVLTVLLGLGLQMFGVYSASVHFLSGIPPREFFRRVKTVMLTAFSTSSSNATLPTALQVCEQNLGVPREISGFVLTIGATANQNGTALYEGVTVLFLAQLSGVELSFAQQLMVVYLAILGGIGTAGVPSGSIPFIVLVLATVGVNPALIGIILGVDRILDMCRTTLNVVGDLTAATYVARAEGFELLGEPGRSRSPTD